MSGEIWFGRPGGTLIEIPQPRGGIGTTRIRPVSVFTTGTGGARVGRTINGKRQFTFTWSQLWYVTYAELEGYHHGHEGPGPFVLHDPSRTNWLTVNQSAATSLLNDTDNFTVSGSGSTLTSSAAVTWRGPRALRWDFEFTLPGALSLNTPATDWHGIPVIANQAITFSFYAQGAGADAIMSLTPQLSWRSTTGSVLSTSSGSPLVTSSSAFGRGTVTGTPPASAAYVLCAVSASGSSAGSTLYLDGFQLERGSTATDWQPGTGILPVQVISLTEAWPWQGTEYREGPVLVLQEVGV